MWLLCTLLVSFSRDAWQTCTGNGGASFGTEWLAGCTSLSWQQCGPWSRDAARVPV
ncbi:hypothetical protein PF005_g16048 [Phytophthora fragariae]|uniref:Uncharacterized protein n=2 Tax=Phytophthora TaxID=4783 RepID=A0A6A3X9E7_9STRA|nr:hypothetical protein PF003_g1543 [Phytophthora fragariae]KAE9006200.1 hypothetical protein PR002_g16556 [Phytophthora rubi]KAE8933286.1 hypothetical protein PF009_g16703 [Phytophthora fragariae]KAE8998136.1 hypothetical protein PF011_g15182 [Phytophthora fragariae]KAE9010201.1 hypothetical protein PR001_g16240 [Phytophthora rubi]